MPLQKNYTPQQVEPRLQQKWQEAGIYHYQPGAKAPVFSIDTPPPTVSGYLHLGHAYSYNHVDFFARFKRMNGFNVFYPMGYDDNGLPTERFVEKRMGITATQVGRSAFIEKCLQMSEEAEKDYQALWQRLGLSIDWRYTYRTIDTYSRRTSQLSFINLVRQGLAYRREAPAIWCPECRSAQAQADVNDLERVSEFVTLRFFLTQAMERGSVGERDEGYLPVATTRPELLPACVAIFVHPQDARYHSLVGLRVTVPLFGQPVPVLEDAAADPQKGTGAVMCCTFGDSTDVAWWNTHHLPLVEALDRDGRMTQAAGEYVGLTIVEARQQIKRDLEAHGLLLSRQPVAQTVRVHERCDTPVEYIVARQWFIRILDQKETFLQAGENVRWHPDHMQARYRAWVENLNWDWCISRQRYFGIPFPVWYCAECGKSILAEESQLPVDPSVDKPAQPCECGSTNFIPDEDIMDTWATSSLTPQIVGQRLTVQSTETVKNTGILESTGDEGDKAGGEHRVGHLYSEVFPFSLRPQAHDIIRTWAFYTIVKSQYHFHSLPWNEVLISGWGLAGEGMGKISKSRGGGPVSPLQMIQNYSADAVRYWAASTGPGKDTMISEERIQMGARLVTKLWNVARFAERFFSSPLPSPTTLGERKGERGGVESLSPADRWMLSRTQQLVRRVTGLFETYEYAAAKNEVEAFFWHDLADNYLEMCKQRLYAESHPQREGARFTLDHVLLTTLKLFAPILPFVTEEIYCGVYGNQKSGNHDEIDSIHTSAWPVPIPELEDDKAEAVGEFLLAIASAVRRYKSERNLPLGRELAKLQLVVGEGQAMPVESTGHVESAGSIKSTGATMLNRRTLVEALHQAGADLASVTRAQSVDVVVTPDPALILLERVEGGRMSTFGQMGIFVEIGIIP